MVVSQDTTPEPEPEPLADLLISEYGEGPSGTSSWGKYVEIYNPNSEAVALSGYRLNKTTNGNDEAEGESDDTGPIAFAEGAVVAAGDVYVIGRATGDDGSPESLYGQLDEVNTNISHNGDDAYKLEKDVDGTWTQVDEFGDYEAADPGSGFTACGDSTTANNSWVRKPGAGNTDWDTSKGTSADDCEWTVVAQSSDALDYSTVGNHTYQAAE